MNYKELLNRTIEKSGLKNVDIIDELKKRNITITPNYLSVLRNSENKIPSVEISRAIAEICNEHKELLVIQGELDKLENGLKEYIEFTIGQVFNSTNIGMELYGTKEQKEAFKNMCPADFICDYLSAPEEYENTSNVLLEKVREGLMNKTEFVLVPRGIGGEVKTFHNIEELKDFVHQYS